MVTRYLDHCCILPSLVLGFGGNKGSVLLRYINNSITTVDGQNPALPIIRNIP